MKTGIDIDTTAFNAMCRELSEGLNSPPERILDEEVGKVLEKAIDNTKAASVQKIKARSQSARFSLQPGTLYTPKRRRRAKAAVLYNLSYHYPNVLWHKISAARMKDLKRRLHARGLAKQSWLLVAQKLGISINAPGYVKSAVATTGKQYDEDATGQRVRGKGSIMLHFENSQPTVNLIGGDEALQQAIDGRTQFFITNIEHDVFTSLATIAKKYPGIRLVSFG